MIDRDPKSALVLRFLQTNAGIISSIEGLDEARQTLGVEALDIFYEVGQKVEKLQTSRERIGYILAAADLPHKACKIAMKAAKLIKIKTQ